MAVVDAISSTIGHGLPREFALVAACCRWPLSDAEIATIRARSVAPIDWSVFLAVVRRQRVAGLVHHAVQATRIDCPPSVTGELAADARRIAAQNLRLSGETLRLQRVFDEAGIPVLFLKGIALVELAYGSLALKHGRDIDLLVAPELAIPAFELIERNGYVLCSPSERLSLAQLRRLVEYGKEAEFRHEGNRVHVEIQWRLAYNSLLLRGIDVHSPARVVSLPGGTIRTLGDEDLFAYLCVHGASHRWSRLKWLADLNAWISIKDHREVTRLYRHANAKGAGLCAGQALLLCNHLLELKLPANLVNELDASRRLDRLVKIALQEMVGVDGKPEFDRSAKGVLREVWTPFLLGQGSSYLAAQLKMISVGQADAISLPLPRSLRFLYPILRLPLWLWRRARFAGSRRGVGWK